MVITRRTLLAATAGAVAGLHSDSKDVPPELIEYFREQLRQHYRADSMLGPHELIGTVTAQYGLVDRKACAARGAVQLQLFSVACAYAMFLGWLHQDAGDLERASYWHELALERAHLAQDRDAVSYALAQRAFVHRDKGDGQSAVMFAEAALAGTGLVPKARAAALSHAAHGYSIIGDRAACDRLLDQAAELVPHVADDHPWGDACRAPGYIESQRATCYGQLGLASQAVGMWDGVLERLPRTARRDRGVFLARQAAAAVAADEPERALHVTREAVTISHETGSARLRGELADLVSHVRPTNAPARELKELLAEASASKP